MCRVARHHTRKHRISTEELEAKLGIHDIRHYVHSRVLRYLGHVLRMDADRTPSLLQRCWVVDGKQPSGKIKVLYDSAVQKLLDEVGLSLLDAANKSEWHNITRPEALAAQARAASGVSAQVAANLKRPSQAAVTKGAASSTSRAAASGASVTASATCKPESTRRNLKPTKPAIEISDADRKRKILITDKCTMAFKKWREKGESFRVDRYRCIEGRCLHQIMSAKTKVTKTKTALTGKRFHAETGTSPASNSNLNLGERIPQRNAPAGGAIGTVLEPLCSVVPPDGRHSRPRLILRPVLRPGER